MNVYTRGVLEYVGDDDTGSDFGREKRVSKKDTLIAKLSIFHNSIELLSTVNLINNCIIIVDIIYMRVSRILLEININLFRIPYEYIMIRIVLFYEVEYSIYDIIRLPIKTFIAYYWKFIALKNNTRVE